DAVVPRDLEDGVHLAPDPGVMHRNHGFRSWRHERAQPGLIQIQGVGSDVAEDRCCSSKHERIDGRYEGEGRDDDLVSRLDLKEECRQLEGMRAGTGQERAIDAERLLEQFVTPPRKRLVPGNLADADRATNVLQLLAPEG